MLPNQRLQLGDDVSIAPELELRLDPRLESGKVKLLEPGDLALREGSIGEPREWRPAPERERIRHPLWGESPPPTAGKIVQSPVQRINTQEQARGDDSRVVGATSQTATPVQRIIAQERAYGHDGQAVPAPTAIQIVEPGGFQWGEAGIGAAATVALMLLAVGTTLVVRYGQLRAP
jgi:hypothetical protein